MCVCMCCVCVCVCGRGGGINRPEVIVSKFISNLIGFYSSFYRHALIQKFLGANFTVHVYIYAICRESEERFTCRPTCRSCRYINYGFNYNLFAIIYLERPLVFDECCMNN